MGTDGKLSTKTNMEREILEQYLCLPKARRREDSSDYVEYNILDGEDLPKERHRDLPKARRREDSWNDKEYNILD